jgi:ribosomal protein S18 acetylase RimI-like enzyme
MLSYSPGNLTRAPLNSVTKANSPALKLYKKYGFRKKKEGINSYILRKDVGRALYDSLAELAENRRSS